MLLCICSYCTTIVLQWPPKYSEQSNEIVRQVYSKITIISLNITPIKFQFRLTKNASICQTVVVSLFQILCDSWDIHTHVQVHTQRPLGFNTIDMAEIIQKYKEILKIYKNLTLYHRQKKYIEHVKDTFKGYKGYMGDKIKNKVHESWAPRDVEYWVKWTM